VLLTTIENVWLDISKNSKQYIIGGIYRHPGQNVEIFTDLFEKQLDKFKKMTLPCLIAGDIIIDLMKCGILIMPLAIMWKISCYTIFIQLLSCPLVLLKSQQR